ncbi:MAG: hypothetical protein AAF483_17175, partial [Planctomycetota bacterium]
MQTTDLRASIYFTGLIFSLSFTPALRAQRPEFETSYNENFLQRSPLIGTKPEATLFDSGGQPFDLSSAEGKYTVVVFG